MCVQVARKEYRGQRSVDAIVEFVRTQLNPPVEVIRGTHELAQKVRQSDWSIKNVSATCCGEEFLAYHVLVVLKMN